MGTIMQGKPGKPLWWLIHFWSAFLLYTPWKHLLGRPFATQDPRIGASFSGAPKSQKSGQKWQRLG